MEISKKYETRTAWVVIVTAVTMVIEIFFGIISGSMALLADGIHMGSHVFAIGLSWLAYVIIRKNKNQSKIKFDSDKVLSLSGYTSGIMLLIFSLFIMIEAIQRLYNPIAIEFSYALIVASVGLIVNIACALLLHHDHEHSDHNIKAAYLHVIADALTSLAAIIGLLAAMIWSITYIDSIAAIISSLVIMKWSLGLLSASGKTLTNFKKVNQ